MIAGTPPAATANATLRGTSREHTFYLPVLGRDVYACPSARPTGLPLDPSAVTPVCAVIHHTMSFEVPDELRYLESHEWTTVDDETVRVGVSDFAQDELGDVVFVELPAAGDEVVAGEAFGVIESIKAVSDLYAPVAGEVVAVNEELFDRPELVNEDPYGDGWMLEVASAEGGDAEGLLDADEYDDQIA